MRDFLTRAASMFLLLFVCQNASADEANADKQTDKTGRPSVIVVSVATRDVSRQKTYVGRAQSFHTVQLTARVEGFLEQKLFKDGGFVKKGDLLFVIEQAAYKAAVEQSESDLSASEAQLKNNKIEYDRNKKLVSTNDVTQETLDASLASLDVSEANVKKAQSGVAVAKLNLSYTEIRSPTDGRIGVSNIDVGNLVGPTTGTLATVVALDPIYVTFHVAETDLIKARKAGVLKGADTPLTPHLQLSDRSLYPHGGKLNYLGVQVDQATDTIEVRAEFPNPDHALMPGQFVNVIIKSETSEPRLVAPQIALQQDQSGHYVLVVDKEGKVEKRIVKLGQQIDNSWVVTDGLSDGERVIVEGIQKVTPGSLVNAVEQGA